MQLPERYILKINESVITLDLAETALEGVVNRLLDSLVEAGRLPAEFRQQAFDNVMEREKVASTALMGGIAIPHGYLENHHESLVAIGVHRHGIDCASIDGEPTRLFILIIDTLRTRPGRIKFLATLNRQLLLPGSFARIIAARSAEDVRSVLLREA